jgi:hypothetical protein
MYNIQFQQSGFPDHQTQYDLSGGDIQTVTDKTFPSPITTSSLDSPPTQKMTNINAYNNMNLPNSPKIYRQQQPYINGYISSSSANHEPFSPQSTAQHLSKGYYTSSSPSLHDATIVSPTSPENRDSETMQRKWVQAMCIEINSSSNVILVCRLCLKKRRKDENRTMQLREEEEIISTIE